MQCSGRTSPPNHPTKRAHLYYGLGLKDDHRLEEAAREFERAIEVGQVTPNDRNNLALIYGSIGRQREAIVLLQEVLALAPDNLSARLNLAMLYYELENMQQARQEFSTVIALSPGSREAVFARSMTGLMQQNGTKTNNSHPSLQQGTVEQERAGQALCDAQVIANRTIEIRDGEVVR